MTGQLPGQLDLFDLLEDAQPVNDPFYRCTCGAELPCSAPRPELAVWAEKHREHAETFAAAQWPAGVCDHCGEQYWDNGTNPYWTFERLRNEHQEVDDGVCWRMAEARFWLKAYTTGKKVMEPHHTEADLRQHIAELQSSYDSLWARYEKEASGGTHPT